MCATENTQKKHRKSIKNKGYPTIPKMGKEKLTPAEAGKGQPTVANYYTVVSKPLENKSKEELLKNEEEIVFLAENNDKSNDNDSTVTTTIQPEKGTIIGPNTAPADDGKELELDKNKNKNKKRSGE